MRKLTATLAVICLVSLLGIGTASASPGGSARPFKCRGTGTFVFDLTNGTVTVSNVQTCTHLGKSTSETFGPFDPTGAATSYSVPNVAANGDELLTTIISTADITSPTTFTLRNETTIDGGTGRFADATGTAVGIVSAVASPTDPMVYNTTYTVTGTISY